MNKILTLLKSNAQPVNTSDNITTQSFGYTGNLSDPKGNLLLNSDGTVKRGPLVKNFIKANYVMASMGKGIPCQPLRRNKIARVDQAPLVRQAFRDGLRLKITLSF